MHIAVLITNTDWTEFAARHPRDRDRFPALIHGVRPEYRLSLYDVPLGEVPATLNGFDGIVIGGSPASVHDDAPWIAGLEELVRAAFAAGIPMFGACFGHQIIAKALGGQVGDNEGPFVMGVAQTHFTAPPAWMADAGKVYLAAAHGEQVTRLPDGAKVIGSADGCEVAAYSIGNKVFCTQHHPEIGPEFLAALVAEYAPKLPPEVAQASKDSLALTNDGAKFAEYIARFFEQARG
jgi:GMP synthase-like glutamine amidotransferase